MQLRADFDSKLTALEDEARKTVAEGSVTFPPAQTRLQHDVLDVAATLRTQYLARIGSGGPSAEKLRQVLTNMQEHVESGHPKLALEAFGSIESSLGAVGGDPVRRAVAEALRRTAEEARILVEFQQVELRIQGIAIQDGVPPVILINNKALSEGDAISSDLLIRGIRPGELELIFRGVVLVRRF
jgi:hypothetical protein